jgi:His/Glu/Gln/Arg/opine family amino acid ABC transporter permease subunit
MMYHFDWSVIPRNMHLLWSALGTTFVISATAEALALGIGLVVGVLKAQKSLFMQLPATVYTEVFRSVPILVLLLWLFFGVTIVFGIDLTPFTAGVVGLGLYYGAFLAEVFRAGIQAIPGGQLEAGYTLGLTRLQTLVSIVLPQAIRIIVPPLANSYVGMIKDATLVSVLGLVELMRAGQLVVARTFRPFEVFTYIAFMYLVITLVFTRAVAWFEARNPIN